MGTSRNRRPASKRSRGKKPWGRDEWFKVAGLVLTALSVLIAYLVYMSSDDTDDKPALCVITEGKANEACPPDDDLPAVSVYRLPDQNRWGVRIRDFNPGTEVTLRLFDPKGRPLELGAYAEREVDARGDASLVDENHYLWEYEPGEPQGMYRLEVTGIDRSGSKVRVVPATFRVAPYGEPAK